MSTLNTYNLKSPDSANTNLALDASGNVAIQAGSASAPSIYVTGDTNTGLYSPGADQVAVTTGGTARLFVDASGRLLVGTSSAPTFASNSNVYIEGLNSVLTSGNGQNLNIFTSSSQSAELGGGITLGGKYDNSGGIYQFAAIKGVKANSTSGNAEGNLVFITTNSTNAPTERMRIDSTGLVTLAGPGIKFPATQVASADANVLDDYEEGTFTPTVIGSSTAGSASYSSQAARYTKVGRLVHFEIYLFWNGGTGAGNLVVAGLPFTCNSASVFPAVTVAGQENVTSSAGTYLNAYVSNNTTNILILHAPTGGGARASVAYDTAGELLLAGVYSV